MPVERAENPSSNSSLEQFTLLAKGARGTACAELVKQALEAPGVHVFGELIDMPNVKEVPAVSQPHASISICELINYNIEFSAGRRTVCTAFQNVKPIRVRYIQRLLKRQSSIFRINPYSM